MTAAVSADLLPNRNSAGWAAVNGLGAIATGVRREVRKASFQAADGRLAIGSTSGSICSCLRYRVKRNSYKPRYGQELKARVSVGLSNAPTVS